MTNEVARSPYDHRAFYASGAPYIDERMADIDTGLRCICGREVVAVLDLFESATGWAHVGVGDLDDQPPEVTNGG